MTRSEMLEVTKSLPAVFHNKLMEWFYGLQMCRPGLQEDALRALRASDFFAISSDEQKIAVAKIWCILLKEAFSHIGESGVSFQYLLSEDFSRFFIQNSEIPGFISLLRVPFENLERLSVTFYDEGGVGDCAILFDKGFCRLADFLIPIVKTPGFRVWTEDVGTEVFFITLMKRWIDHLAGFLIQRRKEPFLRLTGLLVCILGVKTNWRSSQVEFFKLPPFFSEAFPETSLLVGDRISQLIEKLKAEFPLDGRRILAELQTNVQKGIGQMIQEAEASLEISKLSEETGLRISLQSIFFSDTDETEKEALAQRLRDGLGISEGEYEKIYNLVLLEISKGTAKKPAGFDLEELFFRLVLKATEDGVISVAEKSVLKKIAKSLGAGQETFNLALERVREHNEERGRDSDRPEFFSPGQRVARKLALEKRVNEIFQGERAQSSLLRIGKLFGAFREKVESHNPEMTSITDFFYEPQLFPAPTIGIFVEGPSIHPMRLQLIGNEFLAFFNSNVYGVSSRGLACADGEILTIWNQLTDRRAKLHYVFMEEDLKKFVDGVGKNRGDYNIALVQFSTLNPYVVIPMSGFIDHSGKLAQAWDYLNAGEVAAALTILGKLQQMNSAQYHVSALIGTCFRLLGQREVAREENFRKAVEFYQKELSLNPRSMQALTGVGLILKKQGKYENAISWLERAHSLSPGNMQVLGTLASLKYLVDPKKGEYRGELPAYLTPLLTTMYQVNGLHPIFIDMTEKFSQEFQVDCRALVRAIPVDIEFQ